MAQANDALKQDGEFSMAARAAWLHYAGGLTQSAVAKRLGVTSLKAHRLITRANQAGLIKVFIDGGISECVELEAQLSETFDLDYCEVVPDLDQDPPVMQALAMAGAKFLKRQIDSGAQHLIGVGHGRTLAASIDHLPRVKAGGTRFVSLLGGLTRKFAANPHDVIHRLAEKTGAEAYVMPVPFFANSAEDRDILFSQRGISDVLDLARAADLLLVGIGAVGQEASLVSTGMIEVSEIEEIKHDGGAGELLGHFFDESGQPVETPLSERTLALSRADLSNRKIVAIAGDHFKTRAIRSVLEAGYLTGLITDERMARALVETAKAA